MNYARVIQFHSPDHAKRYAKDHGYKDTQYAKTYPSDKWIITRMGDRGLEVLYRDEMSEKLIFLCKWKVEESKYVILR